MAFGFGFGMPRSFAVPPFSPASLFSGGAPGVWYDPSDYGTTGTLFQDSVGTTPVTAVEQPVGLMLDKSQGLVLGPELVVNGDGTSTTGWGQLNTAGCSWAVSGGQFVATTVAGGAARLQQTVPVVAGRTYQISVFANSNNNSGQRSFNVWGTNYFSGSLAESPVITNGVYSFIVTATSANLYIQLQASNSGLALTSYFDNVSIKSLAGNHAFQSTSASRPVLSARVNKLLATATLATQSVTTRATAHTLRFEGAGTVTLTGTAIGVYTAGTHSITTTAGTLTLTVVGSVTSADLRETNDGVGLPVYQAVVTSTNYATTGFLPFLRFDGVDDSLSTNSINFTSTDKMSVFAGVRKLSDAATAIAVELSASAASNVGAFFVAAPVSVGATYTLLSQGNVLSLATSPSSYASPITNTLTGLGDISGDRATLRVNGAQVAQSTTDQGTGNYGNYPLYIGRRGGSSLPFNGQLYSMIIVGKAVNAVELTSTEDYIAEQTGVTLA